MSLIVRIPPEVASALSLTDGSILRAGEHDLRVESVRGHSRPYKHPTPDARMTKAIRESGGNVAGAARSLGLNYRTLYHRLAANPSLWPEGVPHLKRGRPRTASSP